MSIILNKPAMKYVHMSIEGSTRTEHPDTEIPGGKDVVVPVLEVWDEVGWDAKGGPV